MECLTLKSLFEKTEEFADRKVTVGGWVRSNRDSKSFGFLVISDGTFFTPVQVVYHDTMANFAEIAKLNVGTAVIVPAIRPPVHDSAVAAVRRAAHAFSLSCAARAAISCSSSIRTATSLR